MSVSQGIKEDSDVYWIYRAFDMTDRPIFEARVRAETEMVAYFEGLRHLAEAMRADRLPGRRARDLVEPVIELSLPHTAA